MTEAELWSKVICGDMTALSLLYRENYNLLFNWGMKFVADEEFVKDCIQDVFVKICSSRKLSQTSYVRSYLLSSLRNMIFDKISSMRDTVSITEHLFEIDENDAAIDPMFQVDDAHRSLHRKLIKSYNSLTYNQRVSIYLRFVRGLSYKEISAVMDMNPQSAMNLVSRALKSLRAEMGQYNLSHYFVQFYPESE